MSPRSTKTAANRRQKPAKAPTKGNALHAVPAAFTPLVWPVPRTPARLFTQEELAEVFGVEKRTIVNYVQRGMPVAVEKPRPLYRLADCMAWHHYLTWQTDQYQRNRHFVVRHRFTLQHALNWMLPRDHADYPTCGGEFIVVPLRHDHPRRAALLETACTGLPPLPPLAAEPDGDESDFDADDPDTD